MDTKPHHLRPLALSIAVILILAGLVLWTLERLKYPLAAHLGAGGAKGEIPGVVLATLGPLDWLLIGAVIAVSGLLLWTEVRQAALSSALRAGSTRAFGLFVVVLLFWFAHSYLHPGYLLGGDMGFHVSRMNHFALGLAEGKLLFWDNLFNLGVPFLQFTGPLSHWAGGLLTWLTGDPFLSTKLLLFTLHVGAGVAVYLLLRRAGLVPLAALLGAAAYSGAWAHLQLFHYKGVVPQAFTILFLPLGILLIERVAARRVHLGASWSALALVGGLALVNHPSNGMFVGVYMGLFAVAGLALGRIRLDSFATMILAGIAAVLMTVFIVIPVLAEQQWVTMTNTDKLFFFTLPEPELWGRILTWHNANTGTGANFDGYLGLSVIVLALIGVWAAVRGASPDRRFFRIMLFLLIVSLFLNGPHVRTIIFLMFFISLLAGLGTQFLLDARPNWQHLPAILLLIVFVDLGSTSIQPLARTDKTYLADAANYLEQAAPNDRVLLATTYGDDLEIPIWGGGPFQAFPVPQLGLPYGYSATVFHNYGAVIISSARNDLADHGALSEETANALAMINVARIINDNGRGIGMPTTVTTSAQDGPLGPHVTVPGHTPVVLSQRLIERIPEADLDKPVVWEESFKAPIADRVERLTSYSRGLIAETGFAPDTGIAEALAVRSVPSSRPWPDPRGEPWTHSIQDYQVDFDRIALTLHSSRAGFAQLAHAWYPLQRIRHNGRRIEALQGSLNLIVVPVEPGINEYEITPVYSGIRKLTGAVSLTAFLGICGVGLMALVKRYRGRVPPTMNDRGRGAANG